MKSQSVIFLISVVMLNFWVQSTDVCAQLVLPPMHSVGDPSVATVRLMSQSTFAADPGFQINANEHGRPQVLAGLLIKSALAESLVQDKRRESDAVSRQLLGNQVQGCQTTITETRLQFVPDPIRIHARFISVGEVQSQTETRNPQALVESSGRSQFEITKPVYFDGRSLLTEKAYGVIRASQNPVSVRSAATMIPLIGPAADQLAWSEVLRRSPQIDQAMAKDLSQDIVPKIDQSIDKELAGLSTQLRAVTRMITSFLQLQPEQLLADTTEESLRLWIRDDVQSMPSTVSLAESTGTLGQLEDGAIILSDTLLTTLINRWVPVGTTISDNQLTSLDAAFKDAASNERQSGSSIATALPSIFRQIMNEPNSEATLFSIQLTNQSPFRILFTDGNVRIQMNCRIVPRFGQPSDWLVVETAWRGQQLNATSWSIVNVGVDVQMLSENRREFTTARPVMPLTIPLPDPTAADNEDDSNIFGDNLGLTYESATTESATTESAISIPAPVDQRRQTIDEEGLLGQQAGQATPAQNSPPSTNNGIGGQAWPQLIKTSAQNIINSISLPPIPRSVSLQSITTNTGRTTESTTQSAGRNLLSNVLQLYRIQSRDGLLRVSFRLVPASLPAAINSD